MPRPCKCRWIAGRPAVTGFKPVGRPARDLPAVELRLDEIEALRLADLEGLYHEQAAERMGVSRPTFGRLLESARRKVAEALLQSRLLLFQGGHVVMATMRTFECGECGGRFSVPHGTGRPTECPECHSGNICRAPEERGQGRGACRGGRRPDTVETANARRDVAPEVVAGGRGRCRRSARGRPRTGSAGRAAGNTSPRDAQANAGPEGGVA